MREVTPDNKFWSRTGQVSWNPQQKMQTSNAHTVLVNLVIKLPLDISLTVVRRLSCKHTNPEKVRKFRMA